MLQRSLSDGAGDRHGSSKGWETLWRSGGLANKVVQVIDGEWP